jgi:hypothetical protein
VEFAFDTLGMPYFMQSVSFAGQLGAMQRGPDGQIYVATEGEEFLGTLQINEDTTKLTGMTPLTDPLQPFPLLAGTTSRLGLPNFTQIINNPISTPGFDFVGICLGDSTQFNGVGKDPAIDQFDWTFGDGSGANDAGPQVMHLYQAAGTYTVTLRIYNKCEPAGYATFTQDITIVAPPANPSQGVTLCTGSVTLDANPGNAPNLTFDWSTGEITRTITVDRQAIYDVTITDINGCATDGQFLAADNRPQVDFGPNLTLCQNVPLAPLDAQNPGTTYQWTLNGSNTGSTIRTQGVDTSLPGVFEYEVTVTDPITTCFANDSIIYTINESPAFTAVPFNPTSCNAADGHIDLTITAPAGTLFTYFITGPSASSSDIDQPLGGPIVTPGLGAGTYGVTVSDQVSGCATITTVAINDPAFTVGGTQLNNCDPIFINVTITPTAGTPLAPFDYRVIDVSTATNAQPITRDPSGTLTFPTTTPLPSNNEQYLVEVTDANGCTATSPAIDVDEDQTVPATFTINNCVAPMTIQASQGSTFLWSGTGLNIVAGTQDDQTVSANPPQGLQTFNVLITQAGFCDLDTALVVNVNNDVDAELNQSDACADQVTLTATPSGPYTYRWTQNGTPILGGTTLVINLNDDGDTFLVEVVNSQTGCTFPSNPLIASVKGDLQVTLASTPPCEGTPFTLTADSSLDPNVIYSWTLDGVNLNASTPTLVREDGGLYEVTASTPGPGQTCTRSVKFNIVVNPTTPGLLADTGIICPEAPADDPTATVELDAGPGFLLYQWFYEGTAIATATEQTLVAGEVGLYRVDLLNVYQCPSSDEIELVEECDPRITGPNAFRPGSSVISNSDFGLFTFFIDDESFEVFIFNRWGEMIFSSTDRLFRWNGGYNNNLAKPLPPGTYTYVVKYKSSYRPEDGILEKRGGVVLLR